MTNVDDSSSNEDLWYVQLDNEQVRLLSLDQLDEAFQSGQIHERSYVRREADTKWVTLAEMLSGEEQESQVAAQAPTLPVASAQPHVFAQPQQPLAHAQQAYPPAQQAYPPAQQAYPPAQQMARPVAAAPFQSFPPVAQTIQPPGFALASAPSIPNSVIPVSRDVGFGDFDAAAMKPPKSRMAMIGAAALVVIGGIGFSISQMDSAAAPTGAKAAAAALPAAAPLPAPRPVETPAPTPAPVAEAKSDSAAPSGASGKLSDDMKRALLESDKSRKGAKTHKATGGGATPRATGGGKRRGGKDSSPFSKGGNAHDPLNGTL